jgi:hypothetical protein
VVERDDEEITYHSWPSFVGTTWGIRFPHQIRPLLIIHRLAIEAGHSGRDDCGALQWNMLVERISDILSRSGSQGFDVRLPHSLDRGVLKVCISRDESSIIRPLVMVSRAHGSVEGVDKISPRQVLLSEVGCSMGGLGLLAELVEWSMRHVAWESLSQRATSSSSLVAHDRSLFGTFPAGYSAVWVSGNGGLAV